MKRLGLASVACALFVASAFAACTASGGKNDTGATANDTGAGAGNATGGPADDDGIGGSFSSGNGASSGVGGEENCQAIAEEAQPKMQPADIIFGIDTSGSMGEESYYVTTELNNFSTMISASGIDVHVIMLAAPPPFNFPCTGPLLCIPGICIEPPLGSGNCPDDTKLPNYFHVPNTEVSSTDGLLVFYDEWDNYVSHLRADASKTLVVVTDDNATTSPFNDSDKFIADYTALDPVLLQDWKMSGIYSFTDCSSAANPGTIWQEVIDKTGGVHGDLCSQNFQPIFDDLATAIILGAAELPCQWDIPDPPMDEELDPSKVNVVYTDGNSMEETIYKVPGESDCDPVTGGWYYDDDVNPTTITLCPASCTKAQGDPDGKIDILFGCKTEEPPVN